MKYRAVLIAAASLCLSSGCATFTHWKSIPPPGGCDQCHKVPIGNNWQVVYTAPNLSDERDVLAFQTAKGTMPQGSKPESSLDLRKLEEQPCFDCHRTPNAQHKGRTGRFHH